MCNEMEPRQGRARAALKRMWKAAGLPAAVYLAVPLGLPLLNGAARKYGTEFWRHALFTFATMLALAGMLIILELVWERLRAGLKGFRP